MLRETALPAATCASKRARLPPAAIHRKCAQDGVPLGYKGVSCSGDRWNSPLCEICSSVPHKFVRPPSTLPSQHDQHALVLERQALGRNRGAIHVRRITDSCQRVRAWRDRLAAWQSASQTFERAASGKSTSGLLRGRLWDLQYDTGLRRKTIFAHVCTITVRSADHDPRADDETRACLPWHACSITHSAVPARRT